VLLLPGRITRLKGHPDYFRLIKALRDEGQPVHGLVAGDATSAKRGYADELRSLVDSLGIAQDVTFLGHRSDIREVMAASDIVFALSQQPESFGRTVLEAFGLGKPVVGYDCGGVGELLAAFFPMGKVPPGNGAELLAATRAVLAGHPLPQPVEEPYTVDAMCRATLAVYQELRRGVTH
jgi:glycosyltransferase involved in cell wall biosynthesis